MAEDELRYTGIKKWTGRGRLYGPRSQEQRAKDSWKLSRKMTKNGTVAVSTGGMGAFVSPMPPEKFDSSRFDRGADKNLQPRQFGQR